MGELAERVQKELGAQVVAVDISPRMVELTKARGRRRAQADVQSLPFADGEFDCVAANWVLYHVPDLDRAFERAGTRSPVAAGAWSPPHSAPPTCRSSGTSLGGEVTAGLSFGYDNGEISAWRRTSREIERREANGTVVFPDRSSMVDFVAATTTRSHLAERVPELTEPFHTRSTPLRLRGRQAVIRPAELIERKRNGEELPAEEISRADPRLRTRRDPRLPAGRVLHGRVLPRHDRRRDVRAHRRDDPERPHTRPRHSARAQGRRQALDGRRRRQDDHRRRPDRRCVRRPGGEDERARPRPHRRHARQAGVDPRLRRRALRRRVHHSGEDGRARDRRPDRGPRAGGQAALRASRRDRDRGHPAADRLLDHVEEDRGRRRRDRARREGRATARS